jgi:hypothetical protein
VREAEEAEIDRQSLVLSRRCLPGETEEVVEKEQGGARQCGRNHRRCVHLDKLDGTVGRVSKDNVAKQGVAKLHGVRGAMGTVSSFRPKKV